MSHVGPPPPFDAELAAALPTINKTTPPDGLHPETISATRARMSEMEPITNAALARGGAFAVEERTVPGPVGAPMERWRARGS